MDVTREDIERLTAAMNGMTGTLGRVTRGVQNERDAASKTLRAQMGEFARNSAKRSREFEGTVFRTEENLRLLTGSLRDTAQNIRRMIGGVFGGAIVGLVLQRGTEMARTFSDLNEAGYNFGGSMLRMHQAAAAAGLPLSDFADLVKKNGEAMAKMGYDDFASLSLNVRNLTAKSGLYGYTLDQLNEQLGEYATTAAMYGTAHLLNTQRSTERFADLAANTSALAEVTKKSRDEISKLANEAMRGALAIGGMMSLPETLRETTHRTLAGVTAVFAAQQGEAGRMLSKFVADTFGTGFSALTETGKALNDAGMGQLLSDMDLLAEKVRNNTATQEDAYEYSNKFKKAVEQNSQMLTVLAAGGNQQAAQMLEAASHMKYYSAEEIKAAQKAVRQRAAITSLFQSLEHRFGVILGAIQTGFYKGIEPFLKMFTKMIDNTDLSYFETKAKEIGSWLGTFLTSVFNERNMNMLENVFYDLANFGKILVNITGTVGSILVMIAPGLAMLGTGVLALLNGISGAAGVVGGFADKILGTGETFSKSLSAIAVTMAVLFGPKLVKSFVKGFFSSRSIRANIVNVHGNIVNGGGGGGGFPGGFGGGDGRGPRGQRSPWAQNRGGRLGRMLGGIAGLFGGLGASLKNIRPGKGSILGLGALALMGMGMFGASSAMAAEPSSKSEPKAKPVPMKVMRADFIEDAKEKERYKKLLAERENLRKQRRDDKEDPAVDARLAAVEKQLSPFNQRYGITVNDPRDFNYVSLHGRLPPGSKGAGMHSGAAKPQPKPAKPIKKEDENQTGMLDYLSMGLAGASLIPGLGIISGGAGTIVDLIRGDYVGAGLSAASMIPFLGSAAAAGKLGKAGLMAGKLGSKSRLLGGAGVALAGAGLATDLIPDASAAEVETAEEDFTTVDQDSPENKTLNKLLNQEEQQNKMMIMLLAQINQNQKEISRLLTKLLTTR